MTNTPWKNKSWFTSPWNFTEAALSGIKFKDQIKIHDITLRDGEQQAGVVFTRQEKVDIAKRLDEVGVHRIEGGMPVVSPQDEAAIKEMVDMGLKAEIFCLCRCMTTDVRLAKECGVKGITIEIPSSEHIIKYAYRWELKKAIDLSIDATLAAKEAGLYTVFFPIDASRAEMNWFLDLIEQISTEGHMDALSVVDTFGGCAPHAIPYMMTQIKSRVCKPLELHFHDDFSLGVANTLAGLASGGAVAHTTVSGIGERAGNTPMEDLTMALLTMYGVDIGLKTELFYELSKFVLEKAKIQIKPNQSVVGETLFDVESGIIASWMRQTGTEHQLELMPFLPELVGQKNQTLVMGKNSGIDSIRMWLEDVNITSTEEEMAEILTQVKQKAFEKKRLLSKSEFLTVAEKVIER